MSLHLIVGAGAVGTGTAIRLADRGHDVRIVTRSGSGPAHARIERVKGDATNRSLLTELATNSHAIYNAANPPYQKWPTAWPVLADAMLHAVERTGGRLVTMSNLYGFAPGASPMRATDLLEPATRKGAVRAQMWHQALEAHRAGRVRVTEARASDYVGPGLGGTSHFGDRVVPRALTGKTVSFLGRTDVPHSWTYIADVCKVLAVLGTDDASLGRAWHVPTQPPLSAQQMVERLCALAGVAAVKVRSVPRAALRLMGLAVPAVRELGEVLYQFDEPFEIDAADTTTTFGLHPTSLDDQLLATIASYRDEVPIS
ncbi:MAG: NAD-dependent epimerase/dehydratase family protein [Actinomycetota bacterium]|jgi:nucleoside-diphosphate-sugar epimerase|nr:NAD-dependent epimerase/dehydratase family protein [Actinomycetota bacterium]